VRIAVDGKRKMPWPVVARIEVRRELLGLDNHVPQFEGLPFNERN
jgi:hypothetical protein